MNRREFITAIGGATTAWPLAARAQQPKVPTIGYLSTRAAADSAHIVAAFRKGLNETGYVEGQSVLMESRFAEGRYDRLAALAADLVRRQVNVFVATGGTSSAVAAKPVVPATIPMVFAMGGDPVKLGIVASLARPGGNVTGIAFLVNGLTAKHLQLLQELAPQGQGDWLSRESKRSQSPDRHQTSTGRGERARARARHRKCQRGERFGTGFCNTREGES